MKLKRLLTILLFAIAALSVARHATETRTLKKRKRIRRKHSGNLRC